MNGRTMSDAKRLLLLEADQNFPIEWDGYVHFFWAPSVLCFDVPAGVGGKLELRLGFPLEDALKTGRVILDRRSERTAVFHIAAGWNSYFVDIEAGAAPRRVELTIDRPLVVDGDTRELAAMVSYAAVLRDTAFADEVVETNRRVREAVEARSRFSGRAEWAAWVRKQILDDEESYYDVSVLSPASERQLLDPVERYSVLGKRERWIESIVQSGTKLLDIGCGEGAFGFLRHKGVEVHGIDLSERNVQKALRSGYAEARKSSTIGIPYPDAFFDYIISQDVLGHIPLDLKDAALGEMSRALKPDGETLHVAETDDFDPERLTEWEYARAVLVDGHVGIQKRADIEASFRKWFEDVETRQVGNSMMSAKHWIRAHYFYGFNIDSQLLAYLMNLSAEAETAFDIGIGWSFLQLRKEGYDAPCTGGSLYIRAKGKTAQR